MNKLDNYTGVIYRNYKDKLNLKEIIKIKEYCKKKDKILSSNSYKIALKLGLDGAYIPSLTKILDILTFVLSLHFQYLIST